MKKILITLLAILLIATSGLAVLPAIAEEEYYTITITIPTEWFTSVELTYEPYGEDSAQTISVVSDMVYNAKKQTGFELNYSIQNGYKIKEILKNGSKVAGTPKQTYVETSITMNIALSFTCAKEVWSIDYLSSPYFMDGTQLTGSYFIKAGSDVGMASDHTFGSATAIPAEASIIGYDFLGWAILTSEDTIDETYISTHSLDTTTPEIPADTLCTRSDNTIYLFPIFKPQKVVVIRRDVIYDTTQPSNYKETIGSATFQVDFNTNATGGYDDDIDYEGENQTYPGFQFVNESTYYTIAENVKALSEPYTTVYRYYLPLSYNIQFDLNDASASFDTSVITPTIYTYNTAIDLPVPTLRGYIFSGYEIVIDNNVVDTIPLVSGNYTIIAKCEKIALNAKDNSDANATTVVLRAVWTTKEYDIDIELNNGTISVAPEKYAFDKKVTIANPTRKGYIFDGWDVSFEGETLQTGVKDLTWEAKAHASKLTITAKWTAETYEIEFDQNGGVISSTLPNLNANYDVALTGNTLSEIPKMTGYKFLGYFDVEDRQFINENGEFLGTVWAYASTTGKVSLVAHWQVNQYKIAVNVTGDTNATIVIKNEKTQESGTTYLDIDYNTPYSISIVSSNGYKVTSINGTRLTLSQTEYEINSTVEAKDATWNLEIYEKETLSSFSESVSVSYIQETITLPQGKYYVYTVNGSEKDLVAISEIPFQIPEAFFGKTVYIVKIGSETKADSDPLPQVLTARPEKPVFDVDIKTPTADTTGKMVISVLNNITYEYSLVKSLPVGTYTDSLVYENLVPGTEYTLFVRAKANTTHPYGQYTSVVVSIPMSKLVNDTKKEIEQLGTGYTGEKVLTLLANSKNEVNELMDLYDNRNTNPNAYSVYLEKWNVDVQNPDAFSLAMNAILEYAKGSISIENDKDIAIEKVRKEKDRLGATNGFTSANLDLIQNICSSSILNICEKKTKEDIQLVAEQAIQSMDNVPMTYLSSNDNTQMEAVAGCSSDSKWNITYVENPEDIIAKVNALINKGKVSTDGTLDFEDKDAVDVLKTLEILSYYRGNFEGTIEQVDGEKNIRFTFGLPVTLQSERLYVAYYNGETLLMVNSELSNDDILFGLDQLDDSFIIVIFGDSNMNFTGLIVVFSIILLAQLIAIGILLVCRMKFNKANKTNEKMFALLPFFALEVHIAPVHGGLIVVALGVCIIISTIILLYLAATSAAIFGKKKMEDEEETIEPPLPQKEQEEKDVDDIFELRHGIPYQEESFNTNMDKNDESISDTQETEKAEDNKDEKEEEVKNPFSNPNDPFATISEDYEIFQEDDEEE